MNWTSLLFSVLCLIWPAVNEQTNTEWYYRDIVGTQGYFIEYGRSTCFCKSDAEVFDIKQLFEKNHANELTKCVYLWDFTVETFEIFFSCRDTIGVNDWATKLADPYKRIIYSKVIVQKAKADQIFLDTQKPPDTTNFDYAGDIYEFVMYPRIHIVTELECLQSKSQE